MMFALTTFLPAQDIVQLSQDLEKLPRFPIMGQNRAFLVSKRKIGSRRNVDVLALDLSRHNKSARELRDHRNLPGTWDSD